MPLLRLDSANLQFGTQVILDSVNVTLKRGDKLGLLGRNGTGKTTLLKVLAGEMPPDDGEYWLRPGVRLARLQQELPHADDSSVYDVVASGLPQAGALLSRYHHLIMQADADMDELARVQEKLEAVDGWSLSQKVDTTLTQLKLPGDALMKDLSGGWRRRVALGKSLVSEPDILLLDEPTNHLDIPAIRWLETQLANYKGSLILITHDRRFLQNVVNSVAQLDRGYITHWQGEYQGFIKHRDEQLKAEARADALFDKRLAEEEVWIRQGIKARRTRNEGRVRALEAMREERRARRSHTGKATFGAEQADKSGKIVAELKSVSFGYPGQQPIIKDFSTIIQRGDKIGIVGTNGAGKSTLIKLILGQLEATSGTVKRGTKLEIAYFDQLRGQLDPSKTLIDNICGGQEFIEIDGKPRHAISYLGDFLFTPERARTPVKALSGGEQNRAILARILSKPANVLVLDEPTNDLDIETLELLEEVLLTFKGTVFLVSHDRDFMDNVVTGLFILEGDGLIDEQAGSFSDWEARGGKLKEEAAITVSSDSTPAVPTESQTPLAKPTPAAKRKLSYKEQRELDELPATIEELEKKQHELNEQMMETDFYQSGADTIAKVTDALEQVSLDIEAALERWAELDE